MGACTAAAVKIRKHAHDCPIHSRTVPSMLALAKYNVAEPPPLARCCTEHVTECLVQNCLQKVAHGVITTFRTPLGLPSTTPAECDGDVFAATPAMLMTSFLCPLSVRRHTSVSMS